jgi:hypothetical protein
VSNRHSSLVDITQIVPTGTPFKANGTSSASDRGGRR